MKTTITRFFYFALWVYSPWVLSDTAPLDFLSLWQKVQVQSIDLKTQQQQLKLTQVQKQQSDRHILPSIYLDASQFATNDAGAVFFGQLSQRSAEASDFVPATLNNPAQHVFTQVKTGVQWNLYQGGAPSLKQKALNYQLEGQKILSEQSKQQLYFELAYQYGAYQIYSEYEDKILALESQLHQQIENYHVGQKSSNPLGHSGRLGLETVSQQLSSQVALSESKKESAMIQIQTWLNQNESIKLKSEKTKDWIDSIFGKEESTLPLHPSLKLKAQKRFVEAQKTQASAQMAKLKPQLGVFAENTFTHGSRDEAQSQTVGAYFKWQFSFENGLIGREVSQQHAIGNFNLQSQQQKEFTAKKQLFSLIKTTLDNLKRVEQSNKMLQDQLKISQNLFKNGAINGWQLSQVYANRLTGENHWAQAYEQLLYLQTQLHQLGEDFNIKQGGL